MSNICQPNRDTDVAKLTREVNVLESIRLPSELNLDSAIAVGAETNTVYRCTGTWRMRPVRGYLKVAACGNASLINEASVLERLREFSLPIPEVLAHSAEGPPFLFLQELHGKTLWDVVDPRREHYEHTKVAERLYAYGHTLGVIHSLPIDWCSQGRQRLEHLIGEEDIQDERFKDLVNWLRTHEPTSKSQSFVHGDFNTANVLIDAHAVSGVLDWEFAGMGWPEYDLAWALRARIAFLNTDEERSAILSGYRSTARYDEAQLKWCEVLNYLHFARWNAEKAPDYTSFALSRAAQLL